MDYFSKFLKPIQGSPKVQIDRALEFHKSWDAVKVEPVSFLPVLKQLLLRSVVYV
jgi:hypothetical protein